MYTLCVQLFVQTKGEQLNRKQCPLRSTFESTYLLFLKKGMWRLYHLIKKFLHLMKTFLVNYRILFYVNLILVYKVKLNIPGRTKEGTSRERRW